MVEEVAYLDAITAQDSEELARFDLVRAETQSLPTRCIDIPTDRLLAPDRWNGSCPVSDPVGDIREIVARVLQQADELPGWSDWCVDVFVDETTARDGVISVAPAIAFGCEPTLGPRQFVYENFRLVGERTARAPATTVGMCVMLEEWADWPSVGPQGCRSDAVVPLSG